MPLIIKGSPGLDRGTSCMRADQRTAWMPSIAWREAGPSDFNLMMASL